MQQAFSKRYACISPCANAWMVTCMHACVQAEKAALQAEAQALVEYASKLAGQSAELSTAHSELEATRIMYGAQREQLSMDVDAAKAGMMQVEEQKRLLAETKKVRVCLCARVCMVGHG